MKVVEIESEGSISRSGMNELDYCLNPYLGCHHGCTYCYAIDMTSKKDARENWGNVVYVRKNIAQNLASDIKGLRRGIVGISTITDPYQAVEARYRLTGKCLRLLLENGFRVTVQTKSPLARLDFNLLSKYRNFSDIGFTIVSADNYKTRLTEPHTPSPEARFRGLMEASAMGIHTWIYFGPVMRGINDSPEDISAVMRWASSSGSRVIFDFYRNYDGSARAISRSDLNPQYMAGNESWKKYVTDLIRKIAEEFSVEVNSEQEEWLIERKKSFRTLF